MSFRLYESAWVVVEGVEAPCQVHKDADNLAAFNVDGFQYDIDARPLRTSVGAPAILRILSIQDAKEFGLRSHYSGDIEKAAKRGR
jgi:hypothetical protein